MRDVAGRFRDAWRTVLRCGRQVVGIPDYDKYVAHLRVCHPERQPPSYETFFRQRLDARYGRRGPGRCC